ncbi:hypothetical protein C8Q73DRAFT_670866 [Cubamyces lactineus]|nr:hypothetical protein C8Q73DRAFT_670866 [Cubamyces lactineus]
MRSLAVDSTTFPAGHVETYQIAPSSLSLAFPFIDEQSGYAPSAHGQEPCAFIFADTDATTSSYQYSDAECVPTSSASPVPIPDTQNNAPCGSTFSTLTDALGGQTPVFPGGSLPSTPPSTLTSPVATPSHVDTPWSDFGTPSDISSPSPSAYATPPTSPTLELATSFSSLFISRPLKTTTRRNARVAARARHAPAPSSSLSANRWKCPYCRYVQTNQRKPDLARHINTHTSTDEEWVCCGVPLGDAELTKDVPAEVLRKEPVFYNGLVMVGGCRKTFSRRDALKRHLRTREGVCYGNELAPYLVGNQIGAR